MQIGFYLLSSSVSVLLSLLTFAMFIRVILSFIPAAEEWRFTDAVYYISELAVAPVRAVIGRFSWVQALPIDISFLVTYILIAVLQTVLPTGVL